MKPNLMTNQSGSFASLKSWKRIAREAGINESKIRLVTWAATGCSRQTDSREKHWTKNYSRKKNQICSAYIFIYCCLHAISETTQIVSALPVAQSIVQHQCSSLESTFGGKMMWQHFALCFRKFKQSCHSYFRSHCSNSPLVGYLRQLTTMPFCGLLSQQQLWGLSCFDSRVSECSWGLCLSVWNLEKCLGVRLYLYIHHIWHQVPVSPVSRFEK